MFGEHMKNCIYLENLWKIIPTATFPGAYMMSEVVCLRSSSITNLGLKFETSAIDSLMFKMKLMISSLFSVCIWEGIRGSKSWGKILIPFSETLLKHSVVGLVIFKCLDFLYEFIKKYFSSSGGPVSHSNINLPLESSYHLAHLFVSWLNNNDKLQVLKWC